MGEVLVVGGGAAGMLAAIGAAGQGQNVRILEKNEKLGKKIYITGKGRCNLTNACDTGDFFANVVSNGTFLYSAVYNFTNYDMMELLRQNGCPVKTERGSRVFPVSDKASDVTAALTRRLKALGVKVSLNEPVKDLIFEDGRCRGVRLRRDGRLLRADAVIVATGGMSYPSTGSTGDGYRFAMAAGHRIAPLSPALVPFNCVDTDIRALQGLSLRNVSVTVRSKGKGGGKDSGEGNRKNIRKDNGKELYGGFGELLFTHFGVSGPLVLRASSYIPGNSNDGSVIMEIDLKPALSKEQLDKRILRDFGEMNNRRLKNSLSRLFPAKLIPVIVGRSGIDPDKKVNEVSAAERGRLIDLTKAFTVTLGARRGFDEAVITRGGVDIKEINPRTMESRIMPGLYFAGEVLDVDALTGGFNLQIAWSTGMLAGQSAR